MARLVFTAAVFLAAVFLAAAADAQTPSLTVERNTIGTGAVRFNNFDSTLRYFGNCAGANTNPTCVYSGINRNGYCNGSSGLVTTPLSAGIDFSGGGLLAVYVGGGNYPRGTYDSWFDDYPHKKFAVYSDSACTMEVTSVTFERPLTLPTWRVRDITEDSATIYIQETYAEVSVVFWHAAYNVGTSLVPPASISDCTLAIGPSVGESNPTHSLTGLSPGTNYIYGIYGLCGSLNELAASVTFTTLSGDGPPPPDPPSGVDGGEPTTAVNGGSVTISWANPGDSDIASYEYSIRRAGGAAGEWLTVPGSNADTTSVTIDLASGEARAVNNATPPMAEWTIHLRARDVNGNAGGIFTTRVDAAAAGETVPAVPLVGLAMLALFLFGAAGRRLRGTAAGRR